MAIVSVMVFAIGIACDLWIVVLYNSNELHFHFYQLDNILWNQYSPIQHIARYDYEYSIHIYNLQSRCSTYNFLFIIYN